MRTLPLLVLFTTSGCLSTRYTLDHGGEVVVSLQAVDGAGLSLDAVLDGLDGPGARAIRRSGGDPFLTDTCEGSHRVSSSTSEGAGGSQLRVCGTVTPTSGPCTGRALEVRVEAREDVSAFYFSVESSDPEMRTDALTGSRFDLESDGDEGFLDFDLDVRGACAPEGGVHRLQVDWAFEKRRSWTNRGLDGDEIIGSL